MGKWVSHLAVAVVVGVFIWGLMDVQVSSDVQTPAPGADLGAPFLMPIEEVFTIAGRGTVVSGRIERGKIRVGDEVEIVGIGPTRKTKITGIERFRDALVEGVAGDYVDCLLRRVKKEEVLRGQVLAQPRSITPHLKFEAKVYVFTKKEGGRRSPFFDGYRPQFHFWSAGVKGKVRLREGAEMVMPGDKARLVVELVTPTAMEKGSRFAIREEGRSVASGVVLKIIK